MIYAIAGGQGRQNLRGCRISYYSGHQGRSKVITNITLNIDWFVKIFGEHVRDLIKIVDGRLTDLALQVVHLVRLVITRMNGEMRKDRGLCTLSTRLI